MFRIFCLMVFMLCLNCNQNNQPQVNLLEEIKDLQKQARTIKDSTKLKTILEKGIILSEKIKNDTTRINYKRKITCEYYNHNLYKPYLKYSKENLNEALKVKDSNFTAKLYLDVGDYHQNVYQIDSAYFYYRKALPYYTSINKHQILTNYEIARLLCKENLNLESEVIIFQNLQNAIKLNDPETIQNFYIVQGINYYETQQYDLALENFYLGFDYIDKIEVEFINNIKSTYKSQFYLRIGMVYHKKKDYKQARKYYQLSLETLSKDGNKLIFGYAVLYNEEINLIENKPIDIKKCQQVLQISNENNIQENIINSKHLLAKIAFKKNDKSTAFKYLNEAIKLAKELRLNYILLEIYKTLSENNPENKVNWLYKILQIKEDIRLHERLTKNKFAKINYETENVYQKALTLEKKIYNSYLIFTIFILIAIIIFIISKTKTNNKIKKLDKLQKLANLEVYNLLIEQLDLVEKGKKFEKSRISRELHDGIASELYGVRLSAEMDFMKNVDYKENLKNVSDNLKKLEKNVRNLSHELVNFSITPNQLINLIEDLILKHKYYGTYEISIDFNEAFYNAFLPNHLKINLFRIIQETLTNIDKYAKAKNIKITIDLKENYLYLYIKDDGIGFNTLKIKNGIGVKNMKERAEESFGKYRLISKISKGTLTQCVFDLNLVKIT
jgi:two-component system NarL family sensor kinase